MLLNFNLDDVQEQKAAPIGRYELQITAAEPKDTKDGHPMIVATIGFTDLSINAPTFKHYLTLPFEGDPKASFKKLMLKRFLVTFDVPFKEGMDTLDLTMAMLAQTGYCDVALEAQERDDKTYTFNKLNLPRLPDEGQGRRR